jgi:hypothetical protein
MQLYRKKNYDAVFVSDLPFLYCLNVGNFPHLPSKQLGRTVQIYLL